ncbi:MAG: hypothetical protein ACOY93_07670 [Bacillota bacterium]
MRRERLKRWGLALLLTLLAAGCAGPAAAPGFRFEGLDRLAVLRDDRLLVLDEESDAPREVARLEAAGGLAWSADGAWLALRQSDAEGDRLLLVEAATGRTRELTGLPGRLLSYAWAPAGNALAVSVAAGEPADPAIPRGGGVYLIEDPAQMRPRLLAETETGAGGLRWSPDGSRIAWSRTLPYGQAEQRSDALEVVAVDPAGPALWQHVAEGAGINLAGWWPDGRGLLFWTRPVHCNSCAADGLPLRSIALETKAVVDLPATLLTPRWLSPVPGQNQLLLVQGGGRVLWDEKGLALCEVGRSTCRTLPQPEDSVSLDPALSPDGSQIAFVRAQRRPGEWGFASEEAVQGWVESRSLWLIRPDGTGARQISAAGGGIYAPAWSGDGRHLLYIKDGALWALDLEAESVRRVIELDWPENRFGSYGQIALWSHRLAWHRPR